MGVAWSGVMTAYKDRDEQVTWVLDAVAAAGGENAKIAETYAAARTKVSTLNAAGMVTQDATIFMTMKSYLFELNRATEGLVEAGSRVIGAGGPAVQPRDRERWVRTLSTLPGATQAIETAKKRYGVAVGTYNDIMSVFPNRYTAKAVGFVMLPSFDTPIGEGGKPLLRTLTQDLAASSER